MNKYLLFNAQPNKYNYKADLAEWETIGKIKYEIANVDENGRILCFETYYK